MQYQSEPNGAPRAPKGDGKPGFFDSLRQKISALGNKKKERRANPEDARVNVPGKRNKMVIPSYLKPLILFLRGLSILLISGAIVFCTLYYGVKMAYHKYAAPVDSKDDSVVVFIVESGDSLSTISRNLYEQNLVRNRGVFKYYVDFTDRTKNLKAGVYHLNRTMTMDEIIDIISLGSELDNTMNITITEGSTIESMADQIAAQMEAEHLTSFDKDEFLTLCNDIEQFSGEYPFLATLAESDTISSRRYKLEGYLFPDTYVIYLSSDAEMIIRRLLDRTDEILAKPEIAAGIENSGMTIDQVLTLASVVEKEGTTDTFSKVSAVFLNRLASGMKLQSDVTVQYALGINTLALNNGEINTDSPYNTYKYDGLPIGPICNPGQNAITAVVNPDAETRNGGYLFFTLTDPNTGELVFSRTSEEHERVVAQYRPLWEQYDREHGN